MSTLSPSQARPLAALLSCAVVLTSTAAFAVPISPGATVTLNGTSTALRPELAATSVYATSYPFSCNRSDGSVLFKGTLQHDISRDAWGYLDFYYRIIMDPSSPGWVTSARATAAMAAGALPSWVRKLCECGVWRLQGWPVSSTTTCRMDRPSVRAAAKPA